MAEIRTEEQYQEALRQIAGERGTLEQLIIMLDRRTIRSGVLEDAITKTRKILEGLMNDKSDYEQKRKSSQSPSLNLLTDPNSL